MEDFGQIVALNNCLDSLKQFVIKVTVALIYSKKTPFSLTEVNLRGDFRRSGHP